MFGRLVLPDGGVNTDPTSIRSLPTTFKGSSTMTPDGRRWRRGEHYEIYLGTGFVDVPGVRVVGRDVRASWAWRSGSSPEKSLIEWK
jgi:hypothetical protein